VSVMQLGFDRAGKRLGGRDWGGGSVWRAARTYRAVLSACKRVALYLLAPKMCECLSCWSYNAPTKSSSYKFRVVTLTKNTTFSRVFPTGAAHLCTKERTDSQSFSLETYQANLGVWFQEGQPVHHQTTSPSLAGT
jgi:hypothetical protein